MNGLTIRPEQMADRDASISVEIEAFGGPLEAAIVEAIRDEPGSFALVADVDGVVVGHVQVSTAWVGETDVLTLGPIGVLASHRRRGIATSLIAAALDEARRHDAPAVILLGDPGFYGSRGFRPATDIGLANPYAGHQEVGFIVREEDFQIAILDATRGEPLRGVVRWHPAFG